LARRVLHKRRYRNPTKKMQPKTPTTAPTITLVCFRTGPPDAVPDAPVSDDATDVCVKDDDSVGTDWEDDRAEVSDFSVVDAR